jgi:colanic acid/amylovoran biosynthesis glycosyltransferase
MPKPMRIAIVVGPFPVPSQTFILNQITGLIDRGHDVDILAMSPGPAAPVMEDAVERYGLLKRMRYPRAMPANKAVRLARGAVRGAAALARGNGSVLRKALDVRRYGSEAVSLSMFYSALSFLDAAPYDIVHCQFGHLGSRIIMLKEIGALSASVVTSFRGFEVPKGQGDVQQFRKLFAQGDLFLPVSRSISSRLGQAGCVADKVEVLHSGIDCGLFRFTPRTRGQDEPTRLLSIARLVEKKGISYAIRAVAELLRSGKTVSYTVVGDGELKSVLQEQIREAGLEKTVHLVGWKSRAEVRELLGQSHILVAPSVTAENGDQEGIPNVLKEAMATGMPVVGTLHSGIPELVEENVSGLLVAERDVEALARALSHLTDNPQRWPAMGRAGRKRVEEAFDIDPLNDRLVALYQELLEGRFRG